MFAIDYGESKYRVMLNECKISIWDKEKVMELDSGDSCIAL